MRFILVLAIVAAALLGPSTSVTAQEGPRAQLTGSTWRWLRSDYSDDSSIQVNQTDRYTLDFQPNGTLTIRADCNQVRGTYTLVGTRLSMQPGPSTLAACPPDSQVDVFLRDLGAVVTSVFADDNLVLNMRADSGNMVFEPQPAASLTDTDWVVLAYNNGQGAVTTVAADTTITARFTADGTVSGNAGCNTYSDAYTTEGHSIGVGPLATTRLACAEPAMAQESAYLAALQGAERYTLDPQRLVLTDARGGILVLGGVPEPG